MCYNVLCDKYATRQLYGYCPSWALSWDFRKKNILEEIQQYSADIINLQVSAVCLSVCLHDVCLTIAFSYTCHLVVGCRLWGTRGRPNYICNSSPLLGILHSVLFLPNSSMLLSAPSYSFYSFVSPPFCLLSSYPSILPLFQSPLILPLILLLFLVSTGDDCLLYM